MITFRRVPPDDRYEAYQWHRGFAAGDDHLFPRAKSDYGELVLSGAVWCTVTASNDYCAMAYYAEDDDAWEVGGLMVSESERGRGVGSILMRLALGTVLTEQDPLNSGERVIAHVHAENDKPRGLIEHSLKFAYSKSVKIPGSQLPGLRTDDEGYVNGDEFELTVPGSLEALAEWCEGWSGELKDGTPASISLPRGQTLDGWASDLREMINVHGSRNE